MERSSFFDATLVGETYDRVYLADDFARYFASFIGNGVFPTPSTNLQVVQDVNMQVKLKAGKGWINGRFYELTEDLTLNVAVADGVLKRKDRVVLRLDFINREIKAYLKKGAFSSSPISPTLTRNADIYELGIADILINNGVTSVVQSNITDLRQNNTYCGLVAGVVQQIDTTNLFAQFESAFNVWFDAIKGQLSTDAAGNLQNQIDGHTTELNTHSSSLAEITNDITAIEANIIVESGDNTNGHYAKFADGIMTCYRTITLDISLITNQTFATPATFLSVPAVSASIIGTSTAISLAAARELLCMGANSAWITNLSTTRTGTITLCLMATGRWK